MSKQQKMVSSIKSSSTSKRALTTVAGVLGLFVLFFLLIQVGVINGYHEGVLIFIGINIIAAASLNLAAGFLGQMALGHAGFMAIGAYSAGIFVKALTDAAPGMPGIIPFVGGLLVAGMIAALFGVAIGIPALRLRGDYLGIVTLGFGEIIRIAIFNMEPITGGAKGYRGIPHYVGFVQIFFLVAIVLAALYLIIRSRHGRAIIAIREDEIAAESIGIPTTFYKIFGFATSAFFAGIAGAAMAFKMQMIDPKKFTFMYSVEIFIIVVLGGMGSFTGTVIAAVVLGILNELLHVIDNWRLVFYSVLLIIMMIKRPEGLFGRKEYSFVGWLEKMQNRQPKSKKGNL